MTCVVERGTHQIVHGRVDHDERTRPRFLDIEDAAHEQASVADDGAARLEDQPAIQIAERRCFGPIDLGAFEFAAD